MFVFIVAYIPLLCESIAASNPSICSSDEVSEIFMAFRGPKPFIRVE